MATLTLNIKEKPTAVVINIVLLTGLTFGMNYTVNTTNLSTPEYQIATDAAFTNIVYNRVGYSYINPEIITSLIGTYTSLYFRARKHDTLGGISEWSNVFHWTGNYHVEAPYTYNPVNVVPGNYTTPIDGSNYSICITGNQFTKSINIDTDVPEVGTTLYLQDKITKAIPGNLTSFNGGGLDFNTHGIKWIRFNDYMPDVIWDVNPATGVITGQSSTYNCTI